MSTIELDFDIEDIVIEPEDAGFQSQRTLISSMTVIPDKHTFTIWKGATFNEVLTLYETMDNTQPRNLTNYKAEMIIRKQPNDEVNKYLKLTTGELTNPSDNGCSIQVNSSGQIILQITANITSGLSFKSAVYDLTITSPTGVTDALLYGGIKVNGV